MSNSLFNSTLTMMSSNFNAYVPWDVTMFDRGIMLLRGQIGTAFNMGMWIFFIISGIYLVIKIVDSVGN